MVEVEDEAAEEASTNVASETLILLRHEEDHRFEGLSLVEKLTTMFQEAVADTGLMVEADLLQDLSPDPLHHPAEDVMQVLLDQSPGP